MKEEEFEIKFVNDDKLNQDGYLWRYIDFHKFLSFIKNEKIFLTRLDKFEDMREGIAPAHLLLEMIKEGLDKDPIFGKFEGTIHVDQEPVLTNDMDDEIQATQRFNFANCWFYSESKVESAAMWSLYSKPNSVALRIKYKDFKDQVLSKGIETDTPIKRLLLGPVDYVNFQEFRTVYDVSQKIHNSVFIKDSSFEHENEFRIIAEQERSDIPPRKYKDGISRRQQDKIYDSMYEYAGINLMLKEFKNYNFEIVFHPNSSEWAINDTKDLLSKYNISFNTTNSKLKLK